MIMLVALGFTCFLSHNMYSKVGGGKLVLRKFIERFLSQDILLSNRV